MVGVFSVVLALLAPLSRDTSRRGSSFDPPNCGLLRTIYPAVGRALACDFSPDGRLLAVAGENGTVRIYRTGDWLPLRSLRAQPAGVWSLRFSPDGKRVAAAGLDGSTRVLDTESGEERALLRGHDGFVFAVAWTRDGKRLATAGEDGAVQVWDAESWKLGWRSGGIGGQCGAVEFSPDGTVLISGGNSGTLNLWDVSTGRRIRSFADPAAVQSMAVSADGRRLFVGGAADTAVIVEWDLARGQVVRRAAGRPGESVPALRLTPDGRYLISCGGPAVDVWEVSRLRCVATLRHHSSDVHAAAVSPGARWIASCGSDLQVKVWGNLPGGMAKVRPRGFFGIRVQDADGVVVAEVIAGTAAERAGIRAGDVIRAVGGQKVSTSAESIAAIGSFFEGEEAEFAILRGGAELTIRAKLGKRPENLEK